MNNSAYTVLVVADSNFNNLCVNPEEYVTKMDSELHKRLGTDINILTISGKHGLTNVSKIEPIDIDNKNKTSFIHSIENKAELFDELLIISITNTDQYLESLASSMTEKHKTITRYKYKRKE